MSDPLHISGVARPSASALPSSHGAVTSPPRISTMNPVPAKPSHDNGSLAITEHETPSKIHHMSVPGMVAEKEFKRPANVTGAGAVRVRSFHGRLNDDGLRRMDDRINEWLDTHKEIEVKNVTSCIGQWDDKAKEPALVLTVWY